MMEMGGNETETHVFRPESVGFQIGFRGFSMVFHRLKRRRPFFSEPALRAYQGNDHGGLALYAALWLP